MKMMILSAMVLILPVVASGQNPILTSPNTSATQGQLGTATAAPMSAAPKPAAPSPRLPEPVRSTILPDGIRYLNNPTLLNFCTAQVADFNGRDADVIFVGDSITQNWRGPGKDLWNAEFVPRNALDFGVSGDQTQHVLWRLENYPIARLHPKVAVVLIGTNNTHSSPQEIAEGIRAILDKLQSMYPGIKVILNSIMPNARANELMMNTNSMIRTFADDKTVFYLDLVPLMPPVGDNWKGLSADRLHPDAAGYRLWTDALLPLMDRLMPPPHPLGAGQPSRGSP